MKTALMAALAAHDARTSDDAPDSSRSMCGADCGGSPCSREAGHRDRCDPEGTDPSPLRDAIRRALDAPTGPTQRDLAAAIGANETNISAWLNGRRPIPLRTVEAMLAQLDLVIVPRTKIDGAGNSGRR